MEAGTTLYIFEFDVVGRPKPFTFFGHPSGFAATPAEARKANLVQHVMAVRQPPAHTRSSFRKRVKFNC